MIPLNLPRRSNIQGFWKLNELSGTRYDETSNNNDLTDNATVLYGTGKIGNAADFERDNSEYLSRTDALQIGLDITGEITICAWVKLEVLPSVGGSMMVVAKDTFGGAVIRCYGLGFSTATDKVLFDLSSDGTNMTSATSNDAITAGTWTHIATTLNQVTDVMQVYMSGLANGATTAFATDIHDGAADFSIGAHDVDHSASEFFDGLIDEVIIWNKCLTAAEVLRVKNITAYNYSAGIGIGNPYIF